MMYQAKRGGAPLVVIAGESGVRYDSMDAQMAADLVSMARPVTKWSTRVIDPSSTLRVLRKAIKIAATPPTRPGVRRAADGRARRGARARRSCRRRSPTRASRRAAEAVRARRGDARRGVAADRSIIGDGIAFSGAQAELTRVAELLGAEVWGANFSEVNIAADHPLFRGQLGHMFGEHSRAITSQADAVLIVGTYVFPEVFPALEGVFAPGAKVVHVDLDAYEIAKNFPVDVGPRRRPEADARRCSPTSSSARSRPSSARRPAGRTERARRAEAHGARRRTRRATREFDGDTPMHPSTFMAELAQQVPDDVVIFDEALTVVARADAPPAAEPAGPLLRDARRLARRRLPRRDRASSSRCPTRP